MKIYKFDFKAWLDAHGPQGRAEAVALWLAVVADNDFCAPYVRERVGATLEIRREGVQEPLVLPTETARDCFVTLLTERYCGPLEQLSDVQEDLYWAGSRRRAREDA